MIRSSEDCLMHVARIFVIYVLIFILSCFLKGNLSDLVFHFNEMVQV